MPKLKFKDIIIWEGDDYIVINKPPFMSSLDDRNDEVTVLSLAKEYLPDAQLCHRLDKETSGALVVAKNAEAYRHLSMQFENREVRKKYLAVVDGIHDFEDLRYDQPIYKLANGTVKVDKRGKDAVTYFDTKQAYKQHTLVSCKPITGRMHQIRIHLAHLKASITGDLQYGGRRLLLSSIKRNYNLKKGTEEQPLLKRLAL
ncbi:RNA pseudouridine synthase, partial [Fulvivirga sp. RKSG066]|uniref:RluA family pseudouridine synthase n=1 Tax=Fulvivirga aurantia TaxID=2529383 RepID=UPI0012BCD6F2